MKIWIVKFKYRPPHEYFSFLVLPLHYLFEFEISWRHAPLNSPSLFIFVEFSVNFWIADLKANVEVEPGLVCCWDLSFLDAQAGSMNSIKTAMKIGT